MGNLELKNELISAIMSLTEQECESLLIPAKGAEGRNGANRVLPGA